MARTEITKDDSRFVASIRGITVGHFLVIYRFLIYLFLATVPLLLISGLFDFPGSVAFVAGGLAAMLCGFKGVIMPEMWSGGVILRVRKNFEITTREDEAPHVEIDGKVIPFELICGVGYGSSSAQVGDPNIEIVASYAYIELEDRVFELVVGTGELEGYKTAREISKRLNKELEFRDIDNPVTLFSVLLGFIGLMGPSAVFFFGFIFFDETLSTPSLTSMMIVLLIVAAIPAVVEGSIALSLLMSPLTGRRARRAFDIDIRYSMLRRPLPSVDTSK